MKLIIDRAEGEYVVCEQYNSNEIINLDRTLFPPEIRSGDLIEFVDGIVTILPNDEIKERIEKKMNDLWK